MTRGLPLKFLSGNGCVNQALHLGRGTGSVCFQTGIGSAPRQREDVSLDRTRIFLQVGLQNRVHHVKQNPLALHENQFVAA
jgi:hypothetical protein